MQVILKKDVQNLGEAGDIVNVKDGMQETSCFRKIRLKSQQTAL